MDGSPLLPRDDDPPQPRAATAGERLLVAPPRVDDPLLTEIAWRARRLAADLDADGVAREMPPVDAAAAPPPRRAAVLIALCADPSGAAALILTQRAQHLAAHPGQVAFPGGKIEPGESAADAALREAHEEVALPPGAAQVLGTTMPYLTRTGFLVVPVLARVREPVRLAPNPGEVDAVFTVPFASVMTPANHRRVDTVHEGLPRSYYEVTVDGKRVWGVTAAIMRLVHEKLFAP
ncbi:MAG: hypothetical protein AcusKO_40620 [Acuticoccus sp.]